MDLLRRTAHQFLADDDPGSTKLELPDGLDFVAAAVVDEPVVVSELKALGQVTGVDDELPQAAVETTPVDERLVGRNLRDALESPRG